MFQSDWKEDKIAAIIFFLIATVCGLVSGYWLLSFFLWSLVFFVWKYLELRRFYQWYKSGASTEEVPINNGIFEVLTTLVLHNKTQTQKAQKRNKYLIDQFSTTAQALPFATIILNDVNEVLWSNRSGADLLNIRNEDQGNKVDNIIRNPLFVSMLDTKKKDQEAKLEHPLDPERKIQIRLIRLNRYRQLLVARDISAQEALQKSRRAFVANASHELRTPLTVISGYLEMIQSSGDISEDWKEAIDQALAQSNRMEQIIGDMLKLATIEHERYLEVKAQWIDMPALLNRLYEDVKSSQGAQGYHFSAQIDSTLKIRGNESEITSVVLNLMRNAVIHNPPGTQVHLLWHKDHKGQSQLVVKDDGEGIESSHIPHLTERFYRVDNSRSKNIQSTGLGLAIVKHICLNHQAQFDIVSAKGAGSTFKITFLDV